MKAGDLVRVVSALKEPGSFLEEVGLITYVHERHWASTDLFEVLWREKIVVFDGSILREINEEG